MVEVVWVTPPSETALHSPPRESWNPVMFVDGHLDGWGWAHFDSRKDAFGLHEAPGQRDIREGAPGPEEERSSGDAGSGG